eukprot:4241471-Pleurochrysis_carterae.AAC.1
MARSLQPRSSTRMRICSFREAAFADLLLSFAILPWALGRRLPARRRLPVLEVVQGVDVRLAELLDAGLARNILLAAPRIAVRSEVGVVDGDLLVVARCHGDGRHELLHGQRRKRPRACLSAPRLRPDVGSALRW